MKRIQRGFSLVELMTVVAIIGVLSATALPSYQEYTIRAKVVELILAASAQKSSIAEKALLDFSLVSAGIGLTVVPGGKVTAGTVTTAGVITIAGSAATVGTVVTVILTPSLVAANGQVIWACTASTDDHKFVPAECRH